jgi:4-hydroxy-3-methylbut-2-enyl diphosphate reductase
MKKNRLKIKIAKDAGFCFGVKRAISIAEKIAKEYFFNVYTLGPIIHNPQEVYRLKKLKIKTLKKINNLCNGFLILRTHGIPLKLHKKLLSNKSLIVIDATCPFVRKTQNIVKKLSLNVKYNNENIIIVGEKIHPEVISLVSYCNGNCIVLENLNEAKKININGTVNIVSQTTQTPKNFNNIVKILSKKYKTNVYNTICKSTLDRQKSARILATSVDLMIVIGGKNSGNTTRLTQICKEKTRTYHIETAKNLNINWFKKIKTVGLTAGASTPSWIIEDIKNKIKKIK